MKKRVLLELIILSLIAIFIFTPFIVSASVGHPEKFDMYVKALEYMLKGLIEYFKAITDLFVKAITK